MASCAGAALCKLRGCVALHPVVLGLQDALQRNLLVPQVPNNKTYLVQYAVNDYVFHKTDNLLSYGSPQHVETDHLQL